jgi:hypothetical protein
MTSNLNSGSTVSKIALFPNKTEYSPTKNVLLFVEKIIANLKITAVIFLHKLDFVDSLDQLKKDIYGTESKTYDVFVIIA